MKVLLLGASGLLGHNVLHCLMEEKHRAVILVRRADAMRIEGDYEVCTGSLLDYPTLLAAAESCDAIINCAGVTDMSLRRYEDYLPVNRDLCGMLTRLLDETGINILIHTSTVNTIGGLWSVEGGKCKVESGQWEDVPMCAPFTESWYARSKQEGERLVLAAATNGKQNTGGERHIVVVNPGFMLGPWDVKPSSGRMLLAAWRRPLMATPRGGKSFVHVADVAQALVNALTMGRNGHRYIAVNNSGNMTIKELYQMQAEVMGYRQHIITMPNWPLAVTGAVGDLLRFLGIRTDVSTRNVRQLMVREHYRADNAIKELNMPQTPIEVAIRQFHEWRNS